MNIDETIFELLLRWHEVHERDPTIRVEDLCEDCPQHIEPLKRYIAAVDQMNALLTPARGSHAPTLGREDEEGSTISRPLDPVEAPGHEILSVLDQGGMGIVYRARQSSTQRIVALKMILGPRQTVKNLARFRRETESLARFQHPNIVHIYEVGECGGRPYYTMEFIDGGNLAARLKDRALSFRDAARLTITLARAMHAAHEQGIVHRDLKPSNVLLAAGEVPKISDFGLAKRFDQESSSTQTGEIVGTPAYMAPEQAEGRTGDIGPAADIYALGAMLYEMLTGRPPFQGDTPLKLLHKVVSDEPPPPRQVRRDVPRDLEAIALKCLEKSPGRRYLSARALADDLERYVEGRPILARPATRLGRIVKWARRRPEMALLSLLLALLVLAGAGWLVDHFLKEHRMKQAASAAAPQAREILKRHCYECHGQDPATTERNLDVLNHALLIDDNRRLVELGDPEHSRLLQRIEDNSMPPEMDELTLPRVSEFELDILRTWIAGGAPPFPPEDPNNPTPPVVPDSELARKVKQLFVADCYECHMYSDAKGGIKIMDYRLLVTKRKVVVPYQPDSSEVYQLLVKKGKGVMPPPPKKPLSADDIDLVRRWIAEGAPPFPKGE